MIAASLAVRAARPLLPRVARPRTILAGPLRGHRLVTSWHDYPAALLGYTELDLLRWFRRAVGPGETWLDVGAHYGYTALALSLLVGPRGRVFAFEPVRDTAACLAETARVNRLEQLRVVRVGLSDSSYLAPMYVAVDRGMARPTVARASELIDVIALDRAWDALHPGEGRVHGVKLDVQGMEGRALAGMESVLRRHRPQLAIELHPGVDRSALLAFLARCGYRRPGRPVAPLPGELAPRYADDRTYVFSPGAS